MLEKNSFITFIKGQEWKLGEVVSLPRQSVSLSKSGITTFEQFVTSRYICIQEATAGSHGILVKMLGKKAYGDIMTKGGEPFCKDDKNEGFQYDTYFSFRFPDKEEVEMVLGILDHNPSLLQIFEQASMPFPRNATFWVRNMARKMLSKTTQYYDRNSGRLNSPTDGDEMHYRMTVAYF